MGRRTIELIPGRSIRCGWIPTFDGFVATERFHVARSSYTKLGGMNITRSADGLDGLSFSMQVVRVEYARMPCVHYMCPDTAKARFSDPMYMHDPIRKTIRKLGRGKILRRSNPL
jgi:hypothetical protein